MRFKRTKKRTPYVLALAASLSLLCVTAFATEVTVLNGQVSLTDTANTITNSNGTVTATAKGSLLSKKANTITIKNVRSRGLYAIGLAGAMSNIVLEGIEGFDGAERLLDDRTKD